MRKIKTSASIEPALLLRLEKNSHGKVKQKRRIITTALAKAAKLNSGKTVRLTVKYQLLSKHSMRIHLSMDYSLYNILTDCRSAAKRSVSSMFSEALRIILSDLEASYSDSYPDYYYSINCFYRKSTHYTIIKWHQKE